MDIVFHAASGALLVHALGEKRPAYLGAAALVSMLPDLAWGISSILPGGPVPRHVTHSFWFCAIALLVLLPIQWRLWAGLPLHVLVDLPLHRHSPLFRRLHVEGINWYQGWGLLATAALWVGLLVLVWARVRQVRRARLAAAPAGSES